MRSIKNRTVILTALFICLLAAAPALADGYTARGVHDSMLALKDEYYEGRTWTNDNFYRWNGGIYSGGYGCAGFAFALSDAAFGSLRARKITQVDYDAVRVGDILRVNGDSHSVVIMEKYDDFVTLAEGNYGSTIHWGRTMTRDEVLQADYYMTRYPSDSDGRGPVYSTLRLPGLLTGIEAEAFAGAKAEVVIIPDTCAFIGSGAFRDCENLRKVYLFLDGYLPDISSDAFPEGIEPIYVFDW